MAANSRRQDAATEDSWVFDADDGDYESASDPSSEFEERSFIDARPPGLRARHTRSAVAKQNTQSSRPRQAPPKQSRRSVEPELIMPSIPSPSRTPKRVQESAADNRPLARRTNLSKGTAGKGRDRSKAAADAEDESARLLVSALWTWLVLPPARYAYSVFGIIIRYSKPLVAFCLVVWILAGLLHRPLSSAYSSTVTWICEAPLISYIDPSFCALAQRPSGPVEFKQLMTVQSAFEDVLSSSAGSASLPFDMKRGEASVRDLKQVVEFSTLPSRNELVFEFTGFIDTARQASGDLTRFNSRIGRAVDHVLSTNKWTLQIIDGIAAREASRGSVGRFLQDTVFAPFTSTRPTEELLFKQYLQHTRAIEDQIAELILEAQALLGILQNLDDRLDAIHGITTRDGVRVQGNRDELLGQLWTWVGGNRSSMKKNKAQLKLLHEVSVYRRTAWDHVSATVLKLQAIAAGLEDLRERVGAPEVVGMREDVPLRMHIEHIQMGVERLESQREAARSKVEGDHRRFLEPGAHVGEVRGIDGRSGVADGRAS